MRRSARLVAAGAWALLLTSCADPAPAGASRRARTPAHDDTELIPVDAPAPGAPATGDEAPLSAARAEPIAAGASSARDERLAERYARARPLAIQRGSASYYSDAFAGRRTASGTTYEPRAMTAAHRSLPFGSVLRVTREGGARSVYVRVTDRGPYGPRGRILDLSRAAAEELGMLRAGVVKIKLEVVEYGQPRKPRRRRR